MKIFECIKNFFSKKEYYKIISIKQGREYFHKVFIFNKYFPKWYFLRSFLDVEKARKYIYLKKIERKNRENLEKTTIIK